MWLKKNQVNVVLDLLGIIDLPKYIMDMDLREIRKYFGYATTDGIKKTILMRNLIWQIYCRIKFGNPPDFYNKRGFIRGMWYYIKKKFTVHKPLRGDMYGLMSKELTNMVRKGLFSYADFNFRDRDSGTWKLGFDNPHIIIAAEKDGFVTIVEDLYRNYGCHVLTTGGIPSFMTINYMVAAMKKYEIDFEKEFYLITFNDFDPSGYNIGDELASHFKDSGLKNLHISSQWGTGRKKRPWLDLAIPENFKRVIKDHWYELPRKTWDNPLTEEWVKLTKGLDGPKWKPGKKTHGLESDEFFFEEISELFEKAVTPLLIDSSDTIKKRNAMKTLRKNYEDMALVKFLESIQNPKARLF